jgi:peptidoglycan/xylan/chitin deacetylase (PgdA/CDA1 family)
VAENGTLMKNSLLIKNCLFHYGFMAFCRRLSDSGQVSILRYHAIAEPAANNYASPSICLSPALFEAQIKFFTKKYNIISLDDVALCLKQQRAFPPNSVVLTFDDGYRDNYHAYQIMKKYGAHGTFYLAAGCIGEGENLWMFEVIYLLSNTKHSGTELNVNSQNYYFPLTTSLHRSLAIRKITSIIKSNNLAIREAIREQLRVLGKDINDIDEESAKIMLTWEQVQEMSDNGMDIGGHTLTHLNLSNADPSDAQREIAECKKLIEEKTGKRVNHFSYPNGGDYDYYNNSIIEMVKKAGYLTATTSNNGLATLGSNAHELFRIRITDYLPEIVFQMDCEPLISKLRGK